VELPGYPEPQVGRSRSAAILGLASIVLLGASVRWVHHWGFRADALIAAWATATLGAIGLSVWALWTHSGGRRIAKVGLALGMLSILALVVTGIAFAAGADPAGACGGG
jgi:hypothetical protein